MDFSQKQKSRLSNAGILTTFPPVKTRTNVFILSLRFLLKKLSLRRTLFQTMEKNLGFCQ